MISVKNVFYILQNLKYILNKHQFDNAYNRMLFQNENEFCEKNINQEKDF
jgi:hypothetical protein